MKFQQLTIRNIKKIKDFHQKINGNSIIVIGENALGKSTLLNVIKFLLGDKDALQEPIISEGEKSGYAEGIVGADGVSYTLHLILEKGKEPKVELRTKEGLKEKRKGVIASILGAATFDYEEFLDMVDSGSGEKFRKKIKDSMNPEERKLLEETEAKIAENFQFRTSIGQERDSIKGFLEKASIREADFDTYSDPHDVALIQADLEKVTQHNANVTRVKEGMDVRIKEMEDIVAQMAKLQERQNVLAEEVNKASLYLEKNLPKDSTAIVDKINTASEHNSKVTQVASLKEYHQKLEKLIEQYEDMTVLLSSQRGEVESVLKEVGFPVDGLEFLEDTLLYKGMPVRSLSTSEKMRLGFKLFIAKYPDCKVFTMEHGESLGKEAFESLFDVAGEHDMQLILEEVQRGKEELSVIEIKRAK